MGFVDLRYDQLHKDLPLRRQQQPLKLLRIFEGRQRLAEHCFAIKCAKREAFKQ